jgi:hypothetical protein
LLPPGSSAIAGPSSPRHRARQESARPDLKRFFVSRRDRDRERLTVDLDLAADGLVELCRHGETYP